MLGHFKRETRKYPTESKWAVYTGEREGKPMLVRRNESAADLLGHPSFCLRIGIAVPLNAPDERGLPDDTESQQLDIIEDFLVSQLEAKKQSLQVLAITTGGMREFVFYARGGAFSQTIFEALQREVKSHELQAYSSRDEQWELYRQFA